MKPNVRRRSPWRRGNAKTRVGVSIDSPKHRIETRVSP